MKKKLTKILSGMLAVVMVLTSLTVDWGNVIKAEAAEEINQNLLAGDVLCDVDFTEEDVNLMDDRFVASEGTKVKDSWKIGKLTATATTNVAKKGSVSMELNSYLASVGYTADNLVDSNPNTWMSTEDSGRTDPYQDQIIEISLAGNAFYTIDRVSFYPRAGVYGIPEDFTIDVYNGEEWITVAEETGYKTQNWWSKVITPIVGNKVRLHATKLGATDSGSKYAVQLGEIMVFGEAISNVAAAGTAEMEIMPFLANSFGHTADIIKNGNTSDYTSTDYSTTQTIEKTATIVFDRQIYHTVNQVKLYPRSNGAGFPEEFVIDAKCGNEEDDWTPIQTLTGCTAQTMTIDIQPTLCSAIRIRATKLGAADGKYALMLAEIEVYGTPLTNAALNGTVSMNVPDASWTAKYQATQLTDGENAKNSSEIDATDSNNDEFATTAYNKVSATAAQEVIEIAFPNSKYYSIQEIKLYPRLKNGARFGGFPEEFTIRFWNGREWISYDETKVVGCTGNTEDPTEPWGLLVEETVCNKIEIKVTKMGYVENSTTQWAVQLAEVEAYGEPVDFLTTKEAYNSESPVTSVLSLKDITVENFKAEIEMLNFDNTTTQYGVYFGHDAYDFTEGAVYPVINLPTTTVGDLNTLNIEVISDEMKLWWNGFEDEVQTVALPETYDGGYFTLFSTGNDQGGFKSLKIQEYLVRQGADADLAGAELEALNEKFVSSRGITDTNGTKAESVAEHWSLADTTVGRINVAHEKGTPSISDEQASYAPKSALNDENTGNFAGTKNYGQADVADGVYATVEFDGNYKIDTVEIHWRRTDEQPETVELQALIGTTWRTLASKDSYESTWAPDIPTTVCKGIRLKATKLQYYDNGYWLRVKEIQAYGVPTINAAIGGTAEMNVMFDGVKADYLKDGEPYGSSFASTSYVGEYDKQEATVIFKGKNYHEISHIRVFPRSNQTGFPVDFTISIWNGKEWVLATEKFTDYDVTKTGHLSVDIEPLVGNAIKIEATRLGSTYDKGTKYALQLAEIEAWGEPVDFLTTNTTNSEGYTSMLTWKGMKVKNFKAEIELLDFDTSETSYGLYFGQSDYGVVEEGVISVTPRSAETGGIIIEGSAGIDATSVSCVSDAISKNFNQNVAGNNVRPKFSISNFKVGTYDISHILNVEVIDGIIKVWWTGHEEAAWTVEMLPEYYETYKNEGGYVSVFSTGNDFGGIKSMKMQEIIDEEIEVNVDMNVETFGDYAVVNVSNDIAGGILKDSVLKGNLKYDSKKYEYCTTVIEDKGAELYANITETSTGESVAIDLTSYSKAAVAKLYFKNLTGAYDYTGFSLDVDSVTRAKSSKFAQVATLETVTYDYTGLNGKADKMVDARDLVRSVKSYETSQEVREVLIGVPNDWVTAITGEQQSVVYVNAETGSDTGAGTKESPLSSLLLASYRVTDGGTIHVEGNYTFGDTEKTIGMGEKHITVTGTNAVLDITGNGTLGLRGDVTLSGAGVTLKTDGNDSIYANGYAFTIDKDVAFDGKLKFLYGGNNNGRPLERTELNINAGDYELIFGGSNNATSVRNTNVTVGGNTNKKLESQTGSQLLDCVYGGGNYGVVTGDTNVKITGDAKINIVFGGGYSTASYVYGTCNVIIEGGDTMGYYGGSYEGFNHKTKIVMRDGKAAQIFGGNWHSSMLEEGSSTLIQLDGGEVTRRIYGGCYNDVDNSLNWTEWNYVNGTTKVVINADVYTRSSYKADRGICAGSRLMNDTNGAAGVEKETAILQFATQTLYDKYKQGTKYGTSYIGSDDLDDIPPYDQCYIGETLVQ